MQSATCRGLVAMLLMLAPIAMCPLLRAESATPVVQSAQAGDPLATRQVYVPIQDLDVLMAANGGQGVLMDLEEYLAMRMTARQGPVLPDPPTRASVRAMTITGVERASDAGQVGLQLAITMKVDIMVDGWVNIAMGLDGAAFSGVECATAETYLVFRRGKERSLWLVMRGRGQHEVKVQAAMAVESQRGDRRVMLDLPVAVEGSIDLVLMGPQDVTATPALTRTEIVGAGADATTRVTAPLGFAPQLTLLWHRALQGDKLPVLTASAAFLLHVARDALALDAQIAFEIHHAPLRAVALSLPAGFDVFTVEAEELASWAVHGEGESRRLDVEFRSPFQGVRLLSITGESPLGEGQTLLAAAPILIPLGALAAPATLGISADTRLEVTLAELPPEYIRIAPATIGVVADAGRIAVAGMRFVAAAGLTPPILRITAETARIDIATAVLLRVEEARLLADMTIEATARGGPGFAFDILVPAGFRVDEVNADRNDFDHELIDEAGGATRIRGRLDSALQPETSFRIKVVAQAQPEGWRDEWEERSIAFPMPTTENATQIDGVYGVMADAIFDLREGALSALVPLDAAMLAGILGGAETGFGYQLRGENPALEVIVRRKPTLVDVVTGLLFSPEDETNVHVRAVCTFTFAGGGARELELSLPGGTGDTVRFTGNNIAEKSMALEAETGRDRWKLVLQERVVGIYEVILDWDLRRARGAAPFELADVVPISGGGQPVRRELTWVLIEAGDEVEVIATATGLESVALVEIPAMPSLATSGMVVEQYRAHGHEWKISLEVVRHDPFDLLGGFAHSLVVDTWVDLRGACFSQVVVSLVNGSAQFFELALPPSATLWSVHVDGAPVIPSRSARGTILVPIARKSAAAQQLQILYSHRIERLAQSGEFSLIAPLAFVPVLESHWNLHSPRELELLESEGDLDPSSKLAPTPHAIEFLRGLKALVTFEFISTRMRYEMAPGAAEARAAQSSADHAQHAAEDEKAPLARKPGMRSLKIDLPSVASTEVFHRLGGGGGIQIAYMHHEHRPLAYWFTLVMVVIAARIAIARAGWSTGRIFILLVIASGLIPYVLGGDFTNAANALFGAAWLLVAMSLLSRIGRALAGQERVARAPASAVLAAFLICCCLPALAAQEASKERAAPPPPQVVVDPAAVDTPVYILYDPTSGLPPRASVEKVFIPDAIFDLLFRRASANSEGDGKPDEQGMVQRSADYAVTLIETGGGAVAARVEMRLAVRAFGDGWHNLSLGTGSAEIESVTLDGVVAQLRQGPSGAALAFQGAGDHEIVVIGHTSVAGNMRSGRVQLNLTGVPVATLRLIPPEGSEVTVIGAGAIAAEADGRLLAAIGGATSVAIEWQPRTAKAGAQVLHVDSNVAWRLGTENVMAIVGLDYRVERGEVDLVKFKIPRGLEVIKIHGEGLRDWSVKKGDAVSELEILFETPLVGSLHLQIDLVGPPALGRVEWLDELAPADVDHERGSILLCPDPMVEVAAVTTGGITRRAIDGGAPPGWPAGKLAYGFARRPTDLVLQVDALRPTLTAKVSSRLATSERETLMSARIEATIAGAPLASIDLELPAGLQNRRISADRWVRVLALPSDGEREGERKRERVRLVFDPPVSGVVMLGVAGAIPVEGDARVDRKLEFVRVLDAGAVAGDIQISVLDDFEPIARIERGVSSVTAAELSATFPPIAGATPRLGYRFRDSSAVELTIAVAPLEPRLEVHVLTDVFLRDDFADVRYALSVVVDQRRGSVDRFRFEVPAAIDDLEVLTSPAVRFIEKETVSTAAGSKRRFTIHFQGKIKGAFGLELALPLEYDEARSVTVPGLDPIDAAIQGGNLIVENGSSGKADASAISGLNAITRTEVPGLDPERRPLFCYRAPEPGAASLALALERFDRHQATSAQIEQMEITTVAAPDGTLRHEALLRVRNRDKQFLVFTLPEDAELWSVFVDGKAVRPVAGADGEVMVRIRKTEAGERAFYVTLVYETKSSGELGARGTLRAQAPLFVGMEVAETFWTLDLPEGFRFTSHGGGLEPADYSIYLARLVRRLRDERRRLLQDASDATLPTETNTRALSNLGLNRAELSWALNEAIRANPAYQSREWEGAGKQNKLAQAVQGSINIMVEDDVLREEASFLRDVQAELQTANDEERVALGKTIERTRQQTESLGEKRRSGRALVQAGQEGEYKELGQSFLDANEVIVENLRDKQVEVPQEQAARLPFDLAEGGFEDSLQIEAESANESEGKESNRAVLLFNEQALRAVEEKAKAGELVDELAESAEALNVPQRQVWHSDDDKDAFDAPADGAALEVPGLAAQAAEPAGKKDEARKQVQEGLFDYGKRYEEQSELLENLKRNLESQTRSSSAAPFAGGESYDDERSAAFDGQPSGSRTFPAATPMPASPDMAPPAQDPAASMSKNLGVGGGGGGTFSGRFRGQGAPASEVPADSRLNEPGSGDAGGSGGGIDVLNGTPLVEFATDAGYSFLSNTATQSGYAIDAGSGVSLKSLDVRVPRVSKVHSSFQASGAAGSLEISYVSAESARSWGAAGAALSGLLSLGFLGLSWMAFAAGITLKRSLALALALLGGALTVGGALIIGPTIAAAGALLARQGWSRNEARV